MRRQKRAYVGRRGTKRTLCWQEGIKRAYAGRRGRKERLAGMAGVGIF